MAEMEDVVKLCVWRMISSVASTLTKVRAQGATQRVCEMFQNVRALAVPFNIFSRGMFVAPALHVLCFPQRFTSCSRSFMILMGLLSHTLGRF